MNKAHTWRWWLAGIVLAILTVYVCGPARGQELPARGEAPGEEEPAEKPRRKPPPPPPPEAPPEVTPGKPGYYPGIAARPEVVLEVGPITGILAPYGNPLAMDTLLRGWRTHWLGPLRLSPFLEYNTLYRTNILLTTSEKMDDFIHVINPGLRLELPLGRRHKISLGYLGNYFIYSQHDHESHYDHNVNVDAALNFPGGLSLRLGNTYRAATEERTAVTGRQRDYERITPYFLANYKLSDRWRVQGIYQLDALLFARPEDRADDYTDQLGGVACCYRFWPKTALLAQYIIASRDYPQSPQGNNIAHSPFVGLTWDPTAKFTGVVKFGYSFKRYENQLPERDNSPRSWAMSLQTLYRYSRYTQVSLTGQRSIQEDLDFGNNAYKNTAFYLTLNHKWHYFRLASYVVFSYSLNDYLNGVVDPVTGEIKMRTDKTIGTGAGVSRPFTRWLKLRLDYSYANRSSNFSNFSYNEHRILAGVQASF